MEVARTTRREAGATATIRETNRRIRTKKVVVVHGVAQAEEEVAAVVAGSKDPLPHQAPTLAASGTRPLHQHQ
jgi:hypothetical protein